MGEKVIDWTFRIGDFLTMTALVLGGIGFLLRLESQSRASETARKSEYDGLALAVKKVEGQMETLATALVKIAVQDERLKSHGIRLAQLEADVRRIDGRDHANVEPR